MYLTFYLMNVALRRYLRYILLLIRFFVYGLINEALTGYISDDPFSFHNINFDTIYFIDDETL